MARQVLKVERKWMLNSFYFHPSSSAAALCWLPAFSLGTKLLNLTYECASSRGSGGSLLFIIKPSLAALWIQTLGRSGKPPWAGPCIPFWMFCLYLCTLFVFSFLNLLVSIFNSPCPLYIFSRLLTSKFNDGSFLTLYPLEHLMWRQIHCGCRVISGIHTPLRRLENYDVSLKTDKSPAILIVITIVGSQTATLIS